MTDRPNRATRRRMQRAHAAAAAPRHAKAVTGDDVLLAWQLVATETGAEHEIERAKQISHDRVIDHLGEHRRSGVMWRIYTPDRIPALLERFRIAGVTADAVTDLPAWIEEFPDAHVVIAHAEHAPTMPPHGDGPGDAA